MIVTYDQSVHVASPSPATAGRSQRRSTASPPWAPPAAWSRRGRAPCAPPRPPPDPTHRPAACRSRSRPSPMRRPPARRSCARSGGLHLLISSLAGVPGQEGAPPRQRRPPAEPGPGPLRGALPALRRRRQRPPGRDRRPARQRSHGQPGPRQDPDGRPPLQHGQRIQTADRPRPTPGHPFYTCRRAASSATPAPRPSTGRTSGSSNSPPSTRSTEPTCATR